MQKTKTGFKFGDYKAYFTDKANEDILLLDEKAQNFIFELTDELTRKIKYLCICLDLNDSSLEFVKSHNRLLLDIIKEYSLYDPDNKDEMRYLDFENYQKYDNMMKKYLKK